MTILNPITLCAMDVDTDQPLPINSIKNCVFSMDFLLAVRTGNVPGWDITHKFGHTDTVSTSIVPITSGNVFQTPTVAQTLELLSDDAADNQVGIGAR